MRRGSWTAHRGTKSDPNAVVNRLTSEGASRWADFVRIGENLLHPLNDDKSLAAGNASWSYTLSRTGPIRPGQSSSQLEPDAAVHKGATGASRAEHLVRISLPISACGRRTAVSNSSGD